MNNEPAPQGLTDSQKADLYRWLGEQAWSRMQSRRAIEWKTAMGVWSALGGGAAIVIAAPSWAPGLWESLVASGLAIAIVLGYGFWWLPHLGREFQRENKTSYFFQSQIHKIVGTRPPRYLRPASHLSDPADAQNPHADWPSAFDEDPDRVAGQPEGKQRELAGGFSYAARVQLAVTVLFAIIFVVAFFSKYSRHAAAGAAKVTIEGRDIHLESLSKMELNTKDATINP